MPAKLDELSAYVQQIYFFEMERKEKLDTKIQIPLAIITALVGGWLYFTKQIPAIEDKTSVPFIIFALLMAFWGMGLMWSGCKFIAFFRIPDYHFMTDPLEVHRRFYDSLKDLSEEEAEYELKRQLVYWYAKSGNENNQANKLRAANYAKGIDRLLITLIFPVLTGISYLFVI